MTDNHFILDTASSSTIPCRLPAHGAGRRNPDSLKENAGMTARVPRGHFRED
jgi:hypothetical protein